MFRKAKEMVVEIRDGVCFMERGGSREVRTPEEGWIGNITMPFGCGLWRIIMKGERF